MADRPNADVGVLDALLAVQRSLPSVAKAHEADTGKFTYRYASLNDVHDAVLPLLDEHDLLWTVTGAEPAEHTPRGIVGSMFHVPTGGSLTSWWPLPSGDNPQGLGSALTYARRYLLCAMVGLVPDVDDDGAASARPSAERPTDGPPSRTMNDLLNLIDEAHDLGVVGDYDAVVSYAAETPGNLAGSYRKILAAVEERRDALADDGPPPDDAY